MNVIAEVKTIVRTALSTVVPAENISDRTKRVIEDKLGNYVVIHTPSFDVTEDSISQLKMNGSIDLYLYTVGSGDREFDQFTQQVFDAMPPRNVGEGTSLEWLRLRRYSADIDFEKFGQEILGCVLTYEVRLVVSDTKVTTEDLTAINLEVEAGRADGEELRSQINL